MVTPISVVNSIRESDPQNGRNIQVKDLFHKLPREKNTCPFLAKPGMPGPHSKKQRRIMFDYNIIMEVHLDQTLPMGSSRESF